MIVKPSFVSRWTSRRPGFTCGFKGGPTWRRWPLGWFREELDRLGLGSPQGRRELQGMFVALQSFSNLNENLPRLLLPVVRELIDRLEDLPARRFEVPFQLGGFANTLPHGAFARRHLGSFQQAHDGSRLG